MKKTYRRTEWTEEETVEVIGPSPETHSLAHQLFPDKFPERRYVRVRFPDGTQGVVREDKLSHFNTKGAKQHEIHGKSNQ